MDFIPLDSEILLRFKDLLTHVVGWAVGLIVRLMEVRI